MKQCPQCGYIEPDPAAIAASIELQLKALPAELVRGHLQEPQLEPAPEPEPEPPR
jgi:hypothetical protein